jgi:polar amino acid transport system substrate-binding protein
MSVRPFALVGAALIMVAAAGCAPESDPTTAAQAGDTVSCAKDQLKLITAGTFTIGTDKPAYPPWFVDDAPTNGKGFESAVAYAVAGRLGFATSEVKWITVPFTNAYAPGAKKFDVDINQISITDERKQAVDFSSGYYDVAQTVITTTDSKIAGATGLAALKDAKLGAQVGTTSYDVIGSQIQPSTPAAAFDTNDLALAALKNGQLDGLVVDLPTAFYMTGAQLDHGKIIGQLPTPSGATPDQFGLVLDKGNALTLCVSKAVDALKADGTLDKLQQQWLSEGGAPKLS